MRGFTEYKSVLKGALLSYAAVFFALAVFTPQKSFALPVCSACACETLKDQSVIATIKAVHQVMDETFKSQSDNFKKDFLDDFFKNVIEKGMANSMAEMSSAAMTQVAAIGAMMDATQQLDSQRLLQERSALAQKKYQTSEGLCTMGTAAIGLGTAAARAQASAAILDQTIQSRAWRRAGTAAATQSGDTPARFALFRERFCDPSAFGGSLGNAQAKVCKSQGSKSINRDVDVSSTLFQPAALSFDFFSGTANDSPDIIALGNNLFANTTFGPMSGGLTQAFSKQGTILDLRAIAAKRSVATHSFASIAGIKASGGAASQSVAPYVQGIMRQMGASSQEAAALVGSQPGYDTLMEILAKRIYENPVFYTNLYDTPANLARKGAAIRAIDLMQNFDSYKSRLRQESLLSVLVETQLMEEQNRVSRFLGPQAVNAGGK